MRDLLRLPLVLALICAVAAGTLTWVRDLTGAAIEARAAEALAAALRVALPEASQFNDRSAELPALGDAFRNVHEAYEGVHDGRTVGMVFAVAGPGYGGNVEVLVGIDVSGRIAALKVLSAAGETAGLGTKIT
jgi:electron transport complex protein RnfG